ncbi:MAG: glycosyltransferase, partial [Cloacibacterium sp.]|nr:glycosyltransferase [Cloacibacterium sp.]
LDNVHSLLSINYHKFELIVVNDGSKDDTLQKVIEEFNLVETTYLFEEVIPCEPIKKIYRSTDLAYKNLIVIDKINGGGKADAINAGLNIAKYDYFLNIDVDCILHFNTLLIMIETILNEKKRCIGVGATLRMSNSSFVHRGTLEKIGTPKNLFVRFQELEYIRSFVLGKMAWSYINALPNISGGLGMFEKEIVLKIGGYDRHSLGEDMDLIFRMVNYMHETKQEYTIRSIPQTLCWTEGPETLKILIRQRVRWARGLYQILHKNRKVLFNPKYGKMGFIIYPYNLFFEFLSPFIEVLGIALLLFFYFYNQTILFGLLMVNFTVMTFYISLSFTAVFLDRKVFKYYKNNASTLGISMMAFLEPFLYHPLILYSSLKGYYEQFTGKKKKWGEMTRKGFNKK